jgi:4-hydroxy-tetrahydrodipicolinate synthase
MTLRGVFCAAATPVDSNGAIITWQFTTHARNLIADGCDGVALLGTTGEANAFSISARKSLLEAALRAGLLPHQLLPGTGVVAIADTVDLTRHALSLGVTQVVMLPPFYYKNVSDDGVFAAYARIIEQVNDTRLRLFLYHIPQMSAVPISLALISRLRETFPAIVAGIKDSAGDLANMQAMLKAFPDFSVFAGADPLMKPLLESGGHGCITATSNLVGRELAKVFSSLGRSAQSDEVEQAQKRIVAVRDVSNRFAQIPAIKAMLARRYNDESWSNVMPPLVALSAAQKQALDAALQEISA